MAEPGDGSLYAQLGLTRGATDTEVRRAYRNLLTRAHPDKGGDPEVFRRIQAAYDVLSDPSKRKMYDATGRVEKTPDQEFVEAFAGGAFGDPLLKAAAAAAAHEAAAGGGASLADQIIVRQRSGEFQSHTAGFEAWMRSRGDSGGRVFTAEAVAEQFGVARASYDGVPLPRASVLQVTCRSPGAKLSESLSLEAVPLPPELEWGHVLVHIKAAPINAADLYTARLGGVYGEDTAPKLPYVVGHDGVGVVAKVGPGVKSLSEGDMVLPLRPFAGCWATATVWPEKGLLRLPQDGYGLPLEYLAMSRELVCAYQLLEQSGLKPGDAIILNAATSSVGQALLQLARLLRLRAVAMVAPDRAQQQGQQHQSQPAAQQRQGGQEGEAAGGGKGDERSAASSKWERTAAWLRSLGAAEVLPDEGSLRVELDRLRFFARPRLALDAVGGESAGRLADALAEITVRGLNLRAWAASHPAKLATALQALAKLVRAELLRVAYTEYDITEWEEALEHAQERGRGTKILLKMQDPWVGEGAATTAATAAAATADKGKDEVRNGTAAPSHGLAAPPNTPSRRAQDPAAQADGGAFGAVGGLGGKEGKAPTRGRSAGGGDRPVVVSMVDV
ncbi:hypothetical protein GPECTOR_5g168 [Gonium pectorale]|uniref:enoyl-[acyl-carrier-protein] reductase n=1 Tax=Gonium pectorale TaxID=33097 RepID=A0A150GXG4_GONPE|nr:hypothetical protein GPECTOR_5g168 [Gonium pectorale]|eukprot:KXZ54060.1 hypothetical protein GPECTOR_5g168 [Gonium pectorale]